MKKAEKPLFVENLKEELKSATLACLIDYSGLSVKMQQDLKKRLKEVDAKMLIVKNTLFRLAGKEALDSEEIVSDTVLKGPTALIITEEDPIAPLQVLAKFAEEFEIPQFKVGVVEGAYQNTDALIGLSKLPSKDVLVAQTVGGIAAPLYGLVGTLQANLQKLVFVLNQASTKS
jgi:large subunit ribosomal protein L10